MTAGLPNLLRKRMDQLGLDYTVLFPTLGSGFLFGRGRSELDLVGCRAYNEFVADQYLSHADRMTPAAIIPMCHPDDARAELDHAASLGLKVALISAFVWRPIPAAAQAAPELASSSMRLDAFGIDSEYDYDPVWARCVELKLPVMIHGFSLGFTDRSSPTNYVHNHMGHFAQAQEASCRSLTMGGVTRRFPSLRFAFLEGGVSWGRQLNPVGTPLNVLFGSDIGHWDVADMTEPVAESYALVQEGLLTPDEYRAFTCDNAIDLLAALDSRFFSGTLIEDYARKRLEARAANEGQRAS